MHLPCCPPRHTLRRPCSSPPPGPARPRPQFSQSDLAAVTHFLQNHVGDMEARRLPQPDWATIRYMVADIQYAGRITDDFDRLLVNTYAERFYSEGCRGRGQRGVAA